MIGPGAIDVEVEHHVAAGLVGGMEIGGEGEREVACVAIVDLGTAEDVVQLFVEGILHALVVVEMDIEQFAADEGLVVKWVHERYGL